ncbi:FAD:protein FMN transferase [Aureibacter tunicatorum]|uniref:FAD:protein FMN transferase n=1 Tax=Aureibacter tunicatorum TaxID=866807 RepID=A0AAE4BTC9_9BACT|nr:FAD:protein FMN transferase [Aureibacter tunicatorum]MDR6239442.1 thiamine biosynthesis lipoprotein [Aureibacter tunicatorum]BDD04635.1 FAD:protein FMN transferase [Aureibacter tunicatorum]
MKNVFLTFIAVLCYSTAFSQLFHKDKIKQSELESTYTASADIMGTHFDFVAISDDSKVAKSAIRDGIKEAKKIEKEISSWDDHSETSKINKYAGKKPVKVSSELYALIEKCLEISEMTSGGFDITAASFDQIYNEGSNSGDYSKLGEVAKKASYKNIILNPAKKTVYLKYPEMKIGFGAVGKGYAASKVASVMQDAGAVGGFVNADGDVLTWGTQADGSHWNVHIPDHLGENNSLNKHHLQKHRAVSYLHSSEDYMMMKDEKYSEVVCTETGYPFKGHQNVIVVGKDPIMTDAISTAVMASPPLKALKLINNLDDVEGLIRSHDGNVHMSDNFTYSYEDR